ncbi:19286_t:CDS:1, partial [Racocetra persica]
MSKVPQVATQNQRELKRLHNTRNDEICYLKGRSARKPNTRKQKEATRNNNCSNS